MSILVACQFACHASTGTAPAAVDESAIIAIPPSFFLKKSIAFGRLDALEMALYF